MELDLNLKFPPISICHTYTLHTLHVSVSQTCIWRCHNISMKSSKLTKSTTKRVLTCNNPFCTRSYRKPLLQSPNSTPDTAYWQKSWLLLKFPCEANIICGTTLFICDAATEAPTWRWECAWAINKRPALLRCHMVNERCCCCERWCGVSTFAQFPNLQVVGTTAEAKLPIKK